jgi:hypothetical protein
VSCWGFKFTERCSNHSLVCHVTLCRPVNVSEEIFTSEMLPQSYRYAPPYISENINFVIILTDGTPSMTGRNVVMFPLITKDVKNRTDCDF